MKFQPGYLNNKKNIPDCPEQPLELKRLQKTPPSQASELLNKNIQKQDTQTVPLRAGSLRRTLTVKQKATPISAWLWFDASNLTVALPACTLRNRAPACSERWRVKTSL